MIYAENEEGFGWVSELIGGAVSLWGQSQASKQQAEAYKQQNRMLEMTVEANKAQQANELIRTKLKMLGQKEIIIPLLIGIPIFAITGIILLKKLK